MEDVLLPKSFSCSTPSSEEDETSEPQTESVIVTVPASPASRPHKKQVYDARWAALALMFLALLMCVAIILWYIFTNNS
jgi:hypothetical protein